MKYLVIAKRNSIPIPAQHIAPLTKAAEKWMHSGIEKGAIDSRYMYPDRIGFIIRDDEALEKVLDEILEYPLHPFFDWAIRDVYYRGHTAEKHVTGIPNEETPVYLERRGYNYFEVKLEFTPSSAPATEEWSAYEWIWTVTDKLEGIYSISGVSIFELRGEEIISSITHFERINAITSD